MRTALLLIALGFGYKIYLEASLQKAKNTRALGRAIGIVMMTVSILGAVCFIVCGLTRNCSSDPYCPFSGMKSKLMCPMPMSKSMPDQTPSAK